MYSFSCKKKTAYEMRISDGRSDVCSSDLTVLRRKILPAMSILVEWFVVYGAVRNFLTEMIGQDAACGFEHIGTEILPLQLGRTAAFQQTHEHILNHVLQVAEIACPAAEIGQQRATNIEVDPVEDRTVLLAIF